jgi:hypothetical protein
MSVFTSIQTIAADDPGVSGLLHSLNSEGDADTRPEIVYMHAIIAQAGLPRKHVSGGEFQARSGRASLLIRAGKLWNGRDWEVQPIPYGPMPRLLLAHFNTYAVRNRTPEIPLGRSARSLLERLDFSTGGGKRGVFTTFRKQTKALAASHLSLGFGSTTIQGNIVKQFDAWIRPDGDRQTVWPERLIFTEDYFQSLVKWAVPLNADSLNSLRGSALALDIYVWMAHRLHRIATRGLHLDWQTLKEQFGIGYSNGPDGKKNFRREFKRVLPSVLKAYPEAKVRPCRAPRGEDQGYVFLCSRPPVLPRSP